MSAVPPPKKDWLSQKVEKALANRNAENDRTRKAALIEEAVQRLATAGITEDDIKDYFRESILEEERNQ
jgi:DNA-binding transcriptional regulator YhcF (GntR family)